MLDPADARDRPADFGTLVNAPVGGKRVPYAACDLLPQQIDASHITRNRAVIIGKGDVRMILQGPRKWVRDAFISGSVQRAERSVGGQSDPAIRGGRRNGVRLLHRADSDL